MSRTACAGVTSGMASARLNDQIKAVAREMAEHGYIALAADIHDGKFATTRDEAKALVNAFDPDAGLERLAALVQWLRTHEAGNGKVGTVDWCFGGGWSLNTSLATPVDATVIYYGRVNKSAAELAPLARPVLGHFGTLDTRINADMVGGFEAAINRYIREHNHDPKPFVWTKPANTILAKINRIPVPSE